MSVPAGLTQNGLPCGFQLVGRPFDEATLLRVARAYERQTAVTSQRPPFAGLKRHEAPAIVMDEKAGPSSSR